MTSTSSTPSFSQSLPSPTSEDGTDAKLMERGASYFFGFLITFVVLLLIFLCCGVGSRRRSVSRRALMAGGREWEEQKIPSVAPTLWEPQLEKGGLDWRDIAPLSASVLRKPRAPESSLPLPSTTTSTVSLLSPINIIRPFIHKSSQSLEILSPPPDEPPPEALQVAVMIAMPFSPNPHQTQNDSNEMSQLEIGVTRIRWVTEVES